MGVFELLRHGLVVSCQPVDNGAMDHPDITAAMALAAQAGGAAGLRIEGVANLMAVRPKTRLPVIALVKHDLTDSPVRITPYLQDIVALAAAGAEVIAYDATDRKRPVPTLDLVAAIHKAGCLAMADCARFSDGELAAAQGADILGTTLSGYAYLPPPLNGGPDFALITRFKKLGVFVMAEGRIHAPELAGQAIAAGADCVTVGSAITRVEHITQWFAESIAEQTSD